MSTPNDIDRLKQQMLAEEISFQQLIKSAEESVTQKRLTAVDILRLLADCAINFNDESYQLTPRRLLPGTSDFVLQSAARANTVKQLLQSIASSYNIIHGGTYNRVELTERRLSYIIDDQGFDYSEDLERGYVDFILDTMLVFVHGVVCSAAGDPELAINRIQTKSSTSLLRQHFPQISVMAEASCFTLSYDASLADMPLSSCNNLNVDGVYQCLDICLMGQMNKASIIETDVTTLVKQGVRNQQAVAEALNLSVASLKRKLALQKVSFRQLKEQALNQQAQQLLLQGMAAEDVAVYLGFSDNRSFSRAFKSWNQLTPCAFVKAKS